MDLLRPAPGPVPLADHPPPLIWLREQKGRALCPRDGQIPLTHNEIASLFAKSRAPLADDGYQAAAYRCHSHCANYIGYPRQ